MERENDLREQLKFSEEEAKQARRKIGALEQENETLVLQIKKLTNIMRNKKGGKDVDAEEEESSAENLKIQLELLEQEMGVIRRKLDETEKENENLQSEVKYLQEKVINQPLIELPELPKDASSPGVYWENKVRLQEYEIREVRKKMIEKDREIERLNTEVEIYRKKASKVMVRSRSLDNDLQVDLKRQLQLVEQEASILRQKLNSLETENEKLVTENKRMTLRLTKKPPPTSADILQMDNMELKQKLEDQQRKLEAMKEELQKTTAENPVAIIQDYKPRKESLTSLLSENENDLIASLKRRLKAKDEDYQSLQSRAMQLEIENSRLNREYKKLKESIGSKKKPMKAIRDSATRVELRELVSELQDEISELHVTLRSREVVQESLEEELDKVRKELKDSLREAKQKEERLQLTADKTKLENDALKKELDSQKSRASTAEGQLTQISKQSDTSLDQIKKINLLKSEREDADKRAKAAEEALEKKTQRLRDTQEKLNAVSALKEDMARSNRLLESMKAELEKEVDEQRRLLVKAEAKAAELKSQVDMTDRDLLSLKKECYQLRNELEEERSRLKQSSDKQQSEVNNSFIREREEYKRNINDLKNRIEQLQQQIIDNEKLFIEKESRLREEFKRKKESAVKDTREKGDAALELAREEEKILRNKAQELSDKLEKAEKSLREANEKSRKAASEVRREKDEWRKERDNLESEIRAEVKKREKSERESEQMLKQKEEEVLLSKERVVAIEREQRRMQMQLEEVESLQQKLKLMEQEGDKMREEYDHLTSRYDQLEDEFVKTKSKLIQEKEQAEASLIRIRKEHNELSFEMTSLKESYNSRQDAWIKEKLELQERVKELSRRLDKFKSTEQDKRRLQDLVEEKETLIESYKKEEKYLKEERNRLQKRTEDLAKAMEAKIDRPVVLPPLDTGDSKLNKQLDTLRREYEGRMSMMSSEITSMQNQIASLVEERDRLKSQLSMSERNAEEMRTGSLKRERARHREEADAARRKVNELRYQLEDVREQLDDALLENKNLKLQIETDKNSYDIQISEFKSKINQLEEQKIMESTRGQTRNIAKTRLELTWEKERNELQHLLGETQKMVSDLKSRVEQTETEREKEKQAVRKQMLDMRSSTEKDHQDSRRKMSELHSSLLEIRESHAKLRGMYDRMKKEREILLKEREEWRQRLQAAMQLHTKLTEIVKDVEKVSSEVASNSEKPTLPLTDDFKETMRNVKEKFTELQKSAEILKEDERLKRTTSFRRAISAQDMSQSQDPMQRWNNPQRVTNYPVAPPSMIIRPPPRQKTLHRKSLSLDHTLMGTTHEQRLKIWESEGESVTSTPAGSLLSLGGYGYETDSSLPDSEYRYGGVTLDRRRYRAPSSMSGMTTDSEAPYSSREGSVDPGGSSESVPLAAQQQRKTFKDKLKLLRRTKSIDVATGQKLGSTGSTQDKKDKQMSLRSKISKVLQKPLGRSLSLESKKPGPALPPKGVVPDVVPSRPTAEKPLSASRGELSSRKPSSQEEKRLKKKTGVETPV
nr:myosin heavy chain, skeletal muscle [Parasteatoda tepidariorum]